MPEEEIGLPDSFVEVEVVMETAMGRGGTSDGHKSG